MILFASLKENSQKQLIIFPYISIYACLFMFDSWFLSYAESYQPSMELSKFSLKILFLRKERSYYF